MFIIVSIPTRGSYVAAKSRRNGGKFNTGAAISSIPHFPAIPQPPAGGTAKISPPPAIHRSTLAESAVNRPIRSRMGANWVQICALRWLKRSSDSVSSRCSEAKTRQISEDTVWIRCTSVNASSEPVTRASRAQHTTSGLNVERTCTWRVCVRNGAIRGEFYRGNVETGNTTWIHSSHREAQPL